MPPGMAVSMGGGNGAGGASWLVSIGADTLALPSAGALGAAAAPGPQEFHGAKMGGCQQGGEGPTGAAMAPP